MPTTSYRERRRNRSPWQVLGLLFTALFLVLLPAAAHASTSEFPIVGNVKNDGVPLADVRIVVTGEGYEQEALTDADGRFTVQVPSQDGTYEIFLDEETLPEGVTVKGDNPRPTEFGAQSFRPVNFFIGEGVRDVQSFGSQLAERLVNGLNFGLMLALASIGLSLVYGTTGLANFAHAEMVTFGAVMALVFAGMMNMSLWLAIPLALVASGLFGWLLDWGIWKPLRKRRVAIVQVMILSIGLSLFLRYVFQFFIGGGTLQLPGVGGTKHTLFGDVALTTVDMVSMGVSTGILLVVAYWLLFTRIGKATRAIADNRALAAATGIDVEKVIRIVWIASGLLAGLSGILWAYFRPGIKWDMGTQLLLLIFCAVVLGGLGTAFGALIGSLITGVLVEISTLWIPSDTKYVGALLILILVLLVRPQGILGRRERIG
ncbi:MAG: branched-chain amino acid ABC transporter permease [Ornithinimicrobium sp.]|uniref:ABC transporter permease subunit n=1 Tax=Ornithinimicrobium sp. TaxID=1977084 RepID=UPI0026DF7C25|nr:branched-chain amino acid ABC transporter permease [Ornithinimicrobium sp.]MDO5738698.1 branched-chain amino acid ABC transporter permease [Ornithinimicrobium sp.]